MNIVISNKEKNYNGFIKRDDAVKVAVLSSLICNRLHIAFTDVFAYPYTYIDGNTFYEILYPFCKDRCWFSGLRWLIKKDIAISSCDSDAFKILQCISSIIRDCIVFFEKEINFKENDELENMIIDFSKVSNSFEKTFEKLKKLSNSLNNELEIRCFDLDENTLRIEPKPINKYEYARWTSDVADFDEGEWIKEEDELEVNIVNGGPTSLNDIFYNEDETYISSREMFEHLEIDESELDTIFIIHESVLNKLNESKSVKTLINFLLDYDNNIIDEKRMNQMVDELLKPKEIIKELPIEKEVIKEVEKIIEVPVEKIVEKEVIKEVIKTVEVPVEVPIKVETEQSQHFSPSWRERFIQSLKK